MMTDNQPPSNFTGQDNPENNAVDWLAHAPRPTLSPAAKTEIHTRMMAHARNQDFSSQPLRPDFTPILRWALIASVLLIVMLIPTTQIALASVPGDLLYPLKEGIEQLETRLAASPESRAVVSLTHAERRAHEFEVLLSRDQFEPRLLASAYDQLARGTMIVDSEANFDTTLAVELEAQAIHLNASLQTLLDNASHPEQPLAETVIPYRTEAAATQQGQVLPPGLPSDTATATMTATSAASPTFTVTPSAIPQVLASSTPSFTPTATLEVSIIAVGPIEAINGNTIIVYGIEFVFDPDNVLLAELQVGDVVHIDGQIIEAEGGQVTATGISTEAGDDTLAISEDGRTIWRDTGEGCSNPPPSWAPAHGWRARCEGAPHPGNPGGGRGSGRGSNRSSRRS